jgi:glycosyltransferase involved in cell wall biosynthesis
VRATKIVLAVSTTPPTTGQGLAGDLLLEQLPRFGFEVVHLDLSRSTTIRSNWKSNARRAHDAFRLAHEMWRQTRGSRVDLFYLHLGQSVASMIRDFVLLRIARLRGLRSVVHLHGAGFRTAHASAPGLVRRLIGKELRHLEAVIVLSPSQARAFTGLVSHKRIRVVANGIRSELTRWSREPRPRQPGEPLRVLHLSNLIPEKGYLLVLDIARAAGEAGLPLEFTLAGPRFSEQYPDPEILIKRHRLTNTRYIGQVEGEEKTRILATHDVFLFPSTFAEGQPLAILEAMHFGMVTIASSSGGLPDLVDEGFTGWCVDELKPETYIGRLRQLVEDDALRCQMGSEARRTAQLNYSEQCHMASMVDLFRTTGNSGAPARSRGCPGVRGT